MEYLQNLLTVAWHLRWLITIAVILALVAFVFRLRDERDDARSEARGLYFENADLRGQLRTGRRAVR